MERIFDNLSIIPARVESRMDPGEKSCFCCRKLKVMERRGLLFRRWMRICVEGEDFGSGWGEGQQERHKDTDFAKDAEDAPERQIEGRGKQNQSVFGIEVPAISVCEPQDSEIG